MRNMACLAVFGRGMHWLGCQHFSGMTTETVVICWFNARMRLMAFVAVQTRHGHFVRERCPRRLPVTGETLLPVWNKCLWLFRRECVAPQTGYILHTDSMNLPVLVAAQTGVLFRPERVDGSAVAIFARKLFHEYMAGMPR